jgi:hypothetical protein
MLNPNTTDDNLDIVTPSTDAPLKKAAAKKPASKKPAAKKAATKKAPAKKVASKKAAKPKKADTTAEASAEAKPAKKATSRAKKGADKPKSILYMEKNAYKALIQGLKDQGIEHDDAVETLKVGMREANGIPVPQALRMSAGTAMAAAA